MKAVRWGLTGAYALIIFYLSASSIGGVPPFPYFDKMVHFLLYGGLAFLCVWSLRAGTALAWKKALLVAFLLSTVYGVFNEIVQAFLPARGAELMDAAANAAGALAGATLAAVLPGSRGRVRGEAR